MTQIVDSVAGAITRSYDDFNRMTNDTTPLGSVSYTYDTASRRTSMTVSGQQPVSYSYDNANRLTQISQGGQTVAFNYDNGNRRNSTTLPNGVIIAYAYDAASQLTAISYSKGGTSIGNLTYSYDAGGRRTGVGGSLASGNLPAQVSNTLYNATTS